MTITAAAFLLLALPLAPLQAAAPEPAAATIGPGVPVPSPAAEKEVAAILAGFAAPSAKPSRWKTVVCGPLAWKRIISKDAALAQRGIKTSFVKPGQTAGPEGRTFSPGHDDSTFYKSPAVVELAKTFAAGKTRSAGQKERDAFYAVYPGEIKEHAVTVVDAGGDTLVVYADKDNLWLDLLSAIPPEQANAPAPAVSTGTAGAPQTVEDIYTAADLRDPFMKWGMKGTPTKSFSPDEFSIHNLTLRGIMKDKAADYAVFADTGLGQSFVLRRGKLYDAKGKPVHGVTGSMNLKQKSAYLKTAESDVQTFKLGESGQD